MLKPLHLKYAIANISLMVAEELDMDVIFILVVKDTCSPLEKQHTFHFNCSSREIDLKTAEMMCPCGCGCGVNV